MRLPQRRWERGSRETNRSCLAQCLPKGEWPQLYTFCLQMCLSIPHSANLLCLSALCQGLCSGLRTWRQIQYNLCLKTLDSWSKMVHRMCPEHFWFAVLTTIFSPFSSHAGLHFHPNILTLLKSHSTIYLSFSYFHKGLHYIQVLSGSLELY